MSEYDKTATITVPADYTGKTVPEKVIADIVEEALKASPIVVFNHMQGKFNELMFEMKQRTLRESTLVYKVAVEMAGLVMRYAMENQSGE